MRTQITESGSNLGLYIKTERKKAGLTQAQLGEMIGLKAYDVGKIERGGAIPPIVASFILEKLGSPTKINFVKNAPASKEEISYLMDAVLSFSKITGVSPAKSFNYLKLFKGIDFLMEFQELEQLLSEEELVDDLIRVCQNNGGKIK